MSSFSSEKNRNLLVICHSYNSFQKDPTEILASYFSSVNVLVRLHPLAYLEQLLVLSQFEPFSLSKKINTESIPENLHLYLTPTWYLPTNRGYINLGNKHLSRVSNIIKEKSLKFDLIHAHFIWSAGYVGARLKEQYKIPLVITAHGYDIYSLPFKNQTWKKNIQYVLNSADTIITVSQSNLACIQQLDVHTPVRVVPNGFKEDLFFPLDPSECRKQLNLPQNKKILLTVGTLDFTIKGQNILIDSISKIIRKRTDFICIIIGTGKDKRNCENLINSLGLEKFFLLVGGKPHSEIPLWMNACDLFVLPSLSEGNPTVMFEALGCGKPFVGTSVGGVPEIITSEDYGLLVNPGDSEDLMRKILLAMDRMWDREKILAYAERFTWEKIVREIFNIYERVLK